MASQGGAAVDAGSAGDSDVGSPPDAGPAPDGGPATDACVAPDAGAPPALEVLPCPATPPVLWSRTFSQVDVSFGGAADENGNLYWVEYDPPWSYQNPDPPAFLVSADSKDGQNRYRVSAPGSTVGSFMLADGNVVLSQGLVVTAYAAATGARSWSLDLTAARPTGYDGIGWMTDLGDGRIAFTRYSNSEGSTTLYNYLSYACGDHLNPVTIEAYALPGESLAKSGWVQWGGNPGGGNRPRAP